MSSLTFESLPPVQQAIRTRPLFAMHLDVPPLLRLGETPDGDRRIGLVTGGRFVGERLSGDVLPGADWQIARPEGSTTLDVRLILRAKGGALIGMTYRGLRAGPPAVMAELAKGNLVDPSEYYFRTTATFETAAPELGWLNQILAIGVGDRRADGPVYSLFEVL